MWLATLADTHLGEDEMREVIEFLETKEIEACGTPAYKDPAARALKAGVLIVWDPDHLQKLDILTFWPPSETRDSHHRYIRRWECPPPLLALSAQDSMPR